LDANPGLPVRKPLNANRIGGWQRQALRTCSPGCTFKALRDADVGWTWHTVSAARAWNLDALLILDFHLFKQAKFLLRKRVRKTTLCISDVLLNLFEGRHAG